ncbi:hypothetical protein BC936DRAFT_138626 [Jimgerdemannia flammicorona]|uniref:Uncharacterized protein n=1 Tax=Jimgerdemannia flammicorona TaxID=994334 RepID=A0A433DI85_9FUNG|nr:hypothetical protein BC936DRAFT_138626 [Jimgerdemannia flammicorona]
MERLHRLLLPLALLLAVPYSPAVASPISTTSAVSPCCYQLNYEQFSPNNWQMNITAFHSDAAKYGYDFRASIAFPDNYKMQGSPWSPYVLTCTWEGDQNSNMSANNTYDCESWYRQQFFAIFTANTAHAALLGLPPHVASLAMFGDQCPLSDNCNGLMTQAKTMYPASTDTIDLGFGQFPTWAVVVVLVAVVIVIAVIMFVILRRMMPRHDPETRSRNGRTTVAERAPRGIMPAETAGRHGNGDDSSELEDIGKGGNSGKSSKRSLIRKSLERSGGRSHVPQLPRHVADLGSGGGPSTLPMSSVVVELQHGSGDDEEPSRFLNRRPVPGASRKSRDRDIMRDEEGDMGVRGSYSGKGRDSTPVMRMEEFNKSKNSLQKKESNKSLRDDASRKSFGDSKDLPPLPSAMSRRSREAERERDREDEERGRWSARQSREADPELRASLRHQSSKNSLTADGRSRSLTREDRDFMEQRARSRSRERIRGEQVGSPVEDLFIPRGGLPPVPTIPVEHQSPTSPTGRSKFFWQDEADGFLSQRESLDYRKSDGVNSPLRKLPSRSDLYSREFSASSYAATKSTPSRRTYSSNKTLDDNASDDNVPIAVSDGVPLGMMADTERLSISARRSLADLRTPAERERDEWLAKAGQGSANNNNSGANSRASADSPNRVISPRDSRQSSRQSSRRGNDNDDENVPVVSPSADFLATPAAKVRDRTREKQYEFAREREGAESPMDRIRGSHGKPVSGSSSPALDRIGSQLDLNGFPIPGTGKNPESRTSHSRSVSKSSLFDDEEIDPWADRLPREDDPWAERAAAAAAEEARRGRRLKRESREREERRAPGDDGSEDDRPIGLTHERSARSLSAGKGIRGSDDRPIGLTHERHARSLSAGKGMQEPQRDYGDRDRPSSPHTSTRPRSESRGSLGNYRASSAAQSASNLSSRSGLRYMGDENGRESPRWLSSTTRKETDDNKMDDNSNEREGRGRGSSLGNRTESRTMRRETDDNKTDDYSNEREGRSRGSSLGNRAESRTMRRETDDNKMDDYSNEGEGRSRGLSLGNRAESRTMRRETDDNKTDDYSNEREGRSRGLSLGNKAESRGREGKRLWEEETGPIKEERVKPGGVVGMVLEEYRGVIGS